jgi:hypothetical protein
LPLAAARAFFAIVTFFSLSQFFKGFQRVRLHPLRKSPLLGKDYDPDLTGENLDVALPTDLSTKATRPEGESMAKPPCDSGQDGGISPTRQPRNTARPPDQPCLKIREPPMKAAGTRRDCLHGNHCPRSGPCRPPHSRPERQAQRQEHKDRRQIQQRLQLKSFGQHHEMHRPQKHDDIGHLVQPPP